jgi:hypothetical protein
MRTAPVLGSKAWFGPRRLGWGLSPVSPEGWAVTAVAIAAIIAVTALTRHHWWLSVLVVIVLLAVVFLKGTSPGGPQQWQEYQASKNGRDT